MRALAPFMRSLLLLVCIFATFLEGATAMAGGLANASKVQRQRVPQLQAALVRRLTPHAALSETLRRVLENPRIGPYLPKLLAALDGLTGGTSQVGKPGLGEVLSSIASTLQVRGRVFEVVASGVLDKALPSLLNTELERMSYVRQAGKGSKGVEEDGRLSDGTIVSIKSFGGKRFVPQLEAAARQLKRHLKADESALLVVGHEPKLSEALHAYDWKGMEQGLGRGRSLRVMLIDHRSLVPELLHGAPSIGPSVAVSPGRLPKVAAKGAGATLQVAKPKREQRQEDRPGGAAQVPSGAAGSLAALGKLVEGVEANPWAVPFQPFVDGLLERLPKFRGKGTLLTRLSQARDRAEVQRAVAALGAAQALGKEVVSIKPEARWWDVFLATGRRVQVHLLSRGGAGALKKDIAALEAVPDKGRISKLVVAHAEGQRPSVQALERLQAVLPRAQLLLHVLGREGLSPAPLGL